MKHTLSFTLNGEARVLDVEPWEILLDVLRERLGIKTPKVGCQRGECGACTVLLDGRTVRACLILAIEVDGRAVQTVEGLGDDLTPLQEAFIRHSSFQCGFCAPGMVLAATELLERHPHPCAQDVKQALTGNLCRCTGYESIVNAVLDVAGQGGADGEAACGGACRCGKEA